MRCEQVGEMMSARLDGRLTLLQTEALDAHVVSCAGCRAEWEALSSVHGMLSAAPTVAAPQDMCARILARLDRRERAHHMVVAGVVLGLGSLALALLTFSPVLAWLIGAGSWLPIWRAAGPEVVARVLSLAETTARTAVLLLRAFALPAIGLAAAAVVFVVLVNSLWLGMVYRLQPKRQRA